MFAIYKKEMRSYFTTPLGYVFIAVFLAVSGFLFAVSTLQSETSDISGFFQFMIFGYIVMIPILTMRSFAEERRAKTEQILMTSPVSITGMIMAKFLAAFTMFLSTVLVSCLYYIPLTSYAEDPNIGKMGILVGFAGVAIFNNLIDTYFLRYVLSWISIYSRYVNFTYGIFDIGSTVYYLSITAIFLFLSVRVYERRRYA